MRHLALVVVAGVLGATYQGSVLADDAVPELRRHFAIGETGKPIGEVTQIVRLVSDERDQILVLYRSSSGDRFISEVWAYYPDGEDGFEIRDPDGHDWIRRTYKVPFAGKTRDEVQKKRDLNPELWAYEDKDTALLKTKGGGEWRNPESIWKSNRRQATGDLRRSISFSLLEVIERAAADGLFLLQFAEAAKLLVVDHLLYEPNCVTTPPTAAPAPPDCAFDDSFGFPCTEKQLNRIKKAAEEGSVLESY